MRGMDEVKGLYGWRAGGYVVHERVEARRAGARTQLTRTGFAARYGLDRGRWQ